MVTYRTDVNVKRMSVSQLTKYLAQKECNESCKFCPEYDNRWCCPSGMPDAYEYISPYSDVFVIAIKVCYSKELRDRIHTAEDMQKVRENIYDKIQLQTQLILLELERKYPGSLSISTCMLCKTCARRENKPCMHPKEMRYSMTAVGFRFAELLEKEFGIQLLWSAEHLPEYQMMVAALLWKEGGKDHD